MTLNICPTTQHRHHLKCAKCGVDDDSRGPIAATPIKDGDKWQPICAECSTRVQRAPKGMRT